MSSKIIAYASSSVNAANYSSQDELKSYLKYLKISKWTWLNVQFKFSQIIQSKQAFDFHS